MKFTIDSLNISIEKGTVKHPVPEVEIGMLGIAGDAHSGDWHRQISLLASEQIDDFSAKSDNSFKPGDFAENITTTGIDFREVKLLDMLRADEMKLMITQKGKKCHGGGCAIFVTVGKCVMPKEGVFARVVNPGVLKTGDIMEYHPKIFRIDIITLSDRASRGEYKDLSGPAIREISNAHFSSLGRQCEIKNHVIPDSMEELEKLISELSSCSDIIFTTGGTGIGPRDITIETIKPKLDKELPGIMEMIRIKYGMENPKAMISRSIAGTIGNTLVFCMPGSPKAVREYMNEINSVLLHLVYMLYGIDAH
jgi:molybdenum cofactor synthesis domain-containing protein